MKCQLEGTEKGKFLRVVEKDEANRYLGIMIQGNLQWHKQLEKKDKQVGQHYKSSLLCVQITSYYVSDLCHVIGCNLRLSQPNYRVACEPGIELDEPGLSLDSRA